MENQANPILLIRKNSGMSQAAFAAALGVSEPLVRLVEAGSIKTPTALLKALGAHGFDPVKLQEEYHAWRVSYIEKAGRILQAGR